jgi:hypothetical protein
MGKNEIGMVEKQSWFSIRTALKMILAGLRETWYYPLLKCEAKTQLATPERSIRGCSASAGWKFCRR